MSTTSTTGAAIAVVFPRWPEDAEPSGRLEREAAGNEAGFGERARQGARRGDVPRILKQARERLGVSREQVSIDTRISARYLGAFEGEAAESELPEPPYDRYFLREYAGYLGLDPGPLLEAHGAERPPDPGLVVDSLPGRDPGDPRRWTARALVVMSLAVVAAIVAFQAFTPEPADLGSLAPRTSAPAASNPPVIPQPPASPAPSPPARRMTAVLQFSAACWVQAFADGDLAVQETLDPGETLTIRARRELKLRLGNAGGVDLEVNGKRVPTGAIGEVVDLTLRLQEGRVTRT